MIHILYLSATINARDIVRINVRETKSIKRSTKDLINFDDGTKIVFGYVGQRFVGQRFDLIVEDESLIEWRTRNTAAYQRFIDELKHRMAP